MSQEWYTYKILGKEVLRVKIRDEDVDSSTKKCLGCQLSRGKLHRLGCDLERNLCPECKDRIEFMIDCPHEAYEE